MLSASKIFAGAAFLLAAAGHAQAQLQVTVENHPTRADVKFVRFYSELLGFETTTKVVVPPSYSLGGDPVPTVYFLHGTCNVATFDQVNPPSPIPRPGYPFGPCGGAIDSYGGAPAGAWFGEPPSRANFMVVFPDIGPQRAWCGHCWWVDGRNGKGVAAESFLYEELIPVIEQTFNVRRGRNGRAISGKSMGADGTLAQAFRHPDRWRFALAFSPTQAGGNIKRGESFARIFNWRDYLSDQGYGDPVSDEVFYDDIEPFYLTQNVVGSGLEVLVTVGDGCVTPESQQSPDCAQGPEQFLDEFRYRFAKDQWAAAVTERGVDLTYEVHPGRHGTGQTTAYRKFFAGRVERMFAVPAPTPAVFSYSTVDTVFAIWEWSFTVSRPNDEFLHLSGARTDGAAITMAGTGTVTVTTPPLCGIAEDLKVLALRDGVEGDTVLPGEIVGGNRLRFTVSLGTRDPAVDQHRELVESGKFNFPRTRIRLVNSAPSTLDPPGKPNRKPSKSECP